MTVSGCDRELNAHFVSGASLGYHVPGTWPDITSPWTTHWNTFTLKFLNFLIYAVIYLKFKQRGQTLRVFVKKMQMEKQTVKTLIRLLL